MPSRLPPVAPLSSEVADGFASPGCRGGLLATAAATASLSSLLAPPARFVGLLLNELARDAALEGPREAMTAATMPLNDLRRWCDWTLRSLSEPLPPRPSSAETWVSSGGSSSNNVPRGWPTTYRPILGLSWT